MFYSSLVNFFFLMMARNGGNMSETITVCNGNTAKLMVSAIYWIH